MKRHDDPTKSKELATRKPPRPSSHFDISNTDHVMPVNIGDRVSLLCPRPGEPYEYSNIYAVSEEEYTHCFLQNPHLVGSCNNNTQDVTITVVFRQFTPTPGATSDGTLTGIDRRKDGLCTERQMKVKFEVELPKNNPQKTNPKFAARTSNREINTAETSTPIMYIIHVDGEDTDDLDDDQATTAFSSALPILLSLCLFYLI
ncbi:unnamed protein product [Nippostrongylus brasiliensis]|uniref:Ephrin RBD domain-containing protein n=2 Tax=Nippostrongylus brasiliensis TaxID=27835 RepID=A0A0N4YIF8_NIPBR|nr:unnamed protein product [Nippostrongylus brasiliensis]